MRAAFLTTCEEETIEFGRALASALKPGDVIALEGELGAGKTRLVRGVATALGAREQEIASPTYVIAHRYDVAAPVGASGGKAETRAADGARSALIASVHHVDAYRLRGGDELDSIGWESIIGDDRGVVLIEWPSRIAGEGGTGALAGLDPDRVARVTIASADSGRMDDRLVTLTLPPSWEDRQGLETLFTWATCGRHGATAPTPTGSTRHGPERARAGLVGGRLPAGWTRCPTTGRAVSPVNPAFPFADTKARDADLNRWFTGAYTISRNLTADDAENPDLSSESGT
ncbi:MAG: tRNA (adenosine(37)-N6)-threonylcarbamoyltransferase complex ATPase subunit type 1 TsaE [Phycisphaeraceae bacterium]|nr:tRNA (adenosine(37)-N6)-threonylcarbamoyltransferase complex ATPase subunit type 1 TsaE [Phycisphaeraceae bacterium]